jgi:hypothetical protein
MTSEEHLKLEELIQLLLDDAYRFDDKPHRLFYTVKKIAELCEKDEGRLKEISRLMDLGLMPWRGR